MARILCGLMLILLIGGCAADGGKQKKAARIRNRGNASVEETIRAVIAEQCNKTPEQVDMRKPLSAPPLGMDELDLVETVMTLEEEFGITIADEVLEKRAGIRFEQAATKLTPADLVSIVNESKGNPPRK